VSELEFLSEPDTSSLKQTIFTGRMAEAVHEQINGWLKEGVIREVQYTPKAVTPMLVVPKPHSDQLRICLDFRLMNSCVKQVWAPPIDRHALIRTLERKKYFSTIDVSSAFLCIKLADHLQEYFGIYFRDRFFVFQRLPFGFHNSMNFFLRAIRFTLAKVQPMLPSDVTIASYVDDICVASNSRDSHVKALRILFSALEMDGWTANIGKCKFLQQSVLFLGVNYSRGGTAPDPALLTKLRNLQLSIGAHLSAFEAILEVETRHV